MEKVPNGKKKQLVDVAIKQVRDTFGKGSLLILGETKILEIIESISTGSILLNEICGIGGIPRGRITELYGQEGSGKTTIALHLIANAQKNGGTCAFIDAEHALDPMYAKNLGVNLDNLLLSQPESGEQALEITDMLIRSNAIDLIVIDSVAALVPKAELEGDMGDATMGSQARLMSQALRKMTGNISKSNTAVLFLNQVRSKIGVVFGNPEVTTGGNALKFYASLRMQIIKKTQIKVGDQIMGHEAEVKINKNKFYPPFKKANIEIYYGRGISLDGEIISMALDRNILEKGGSWFSFEGVKIANGKENMLKLLQNDKTLREKLLKLIKEKKDIIDLTNKDSDLDSEKDNDI